MKLFLISSLLLISSIQAKVECYYRFTDSILTISPEMKVNGCTADFIWGFDNACFKGEAESLVEKINEGYYTWKSAGYRAKNAKRVDNDTVSYIGVDAQSFYSSEREIMRCQN